MPNSLNDSITDKVTGESKTNYDNEAAQVKALEKTLGRKRVLYKDFQFFVTQLSKKENLKRLRDDIEKAEQGSKIREQKEKELQVALERIQKNAYEAAAKRYENLVEHSTSVYAQEMGRVYIQQEKDRQEEIENTFRLQLMQIKQLEEEYNGEAPLNVILAHMSDKYGVSEDKTEQIIKNLRQKGVIYEPRAGYVKKA